MKPGGHVGFWFGGVDTVYVYSFRVGEAHSQDQNTKKEQR